VAIGSLTVGERRLWQPPRKKVTMPKAKKAEIFNDIGMKACCCNDKARKLNRIMRAEQLKGVMSC